MPLTGRCATSNWEMLKFSRNAVELIVAIIALAEDQVIVVQTSLIGSVLSNLLLVLGMCFLLGGYNRSEQYFNTTVAQTAASVLALALGSLIIPTIFTYNTGIVGGDVAKLSHGVSVILLFVYACYLFFQLKTHSEMFNEESQKVPGKQYEMPGRDMLYKSLPIVNKPLFKKTEDLPEHAIASGIARSGAGAAFAAAPTPHRDMSAMMMGPNTHHVPEDEDEDEGPQLHIGVAFAQMTLVTVIIAFCAEAMVSGIEAITSSGIVSEEFVGLILLPIVGNACEHVTAITVAMKDKMDLAIGVAIGSSMQVALFLIPLLVIIGWGMGNEYMNLAFDPFQVVVLFVSVLLVNYLISDGKSHWLEGMLLVCLYFIIAVCTWCKFRVAVSPDNPRQFADLFPNRVPCRPRSNPAGNPDGGARLNRQFMEWLSGSPGDVFAFFVLFASSSKNTCPKRCIQRPKIFQ